MQHAHKKILRRTLLITLAVIFLVESWLWEKTGALIAWGIAQLPFEALKKRIAARIEHLAPLPTLGLFVIPIITLLPLKFMALWLLSKGFFFRGISTIIFAKLAGFGVFSFMFTLCKPKLLQMRFVAWVYHTCVRWRAWAHELVRPYTRYVGRYMRALMPRGPLGKLLTTIRARVRRKR